MPDLVSIGIVIVLAGFVLVFLAMMMSGREPQGGEKETRVKGGGVILIGPIPIVFGSDARWASVAIALAILLIVVVLFSGILVRQ